MIRKIGYSLFILSLLLLVGCVNTPLKNQPYHIHPTLEIQIFDNTLVIPKEIGLAPNNHQVIHTHEEDGTLHVESSITRDFYLKEFFQIWDKKFDNSCIFDYCANSTHQLKVYVNSVEDYRFENILLEDDQKIRIVYAER